VIYRKDILDILALFGIRVDASDVDALRVPPDNYEPIVRLRNNLLEKIDEIDTTQTNNLVPHTDDWGIIPLSALKESTETQFSFAYIGSEDLTMYPILLPGSLVQIDESKTQIANGPWRNEYERPIYFVKTREGYTCSWCSLSRDQIVLQPHPLSSVQVRVLKFPEAAEIIGQVVGIAIDLRRSDPSSWPKRLNRPELIQ
jgi:hypothetical protein